MSSSDRPRTRRRLRRGAVAGVVALAAISIVTAAGGAVLAASGDPAPAPAPVISEVGGARTVTNGNTPKVTTALPAGATTGDLVVSVVSTYGFATVRFAAGWTTASESGSASGVRVVTAFRRLTGSGDPLQVAAAISPRTQASMVTLALRNADATAPVARSGPGAASPAVDVAAPGSALVLTHGSTAWRFAPSPPAGSTVVGVARSGNTEAAAALRLGVGAGSLAAQSWQATPRGADAAAGVLVIRPAAPSTSTPTSTATSTATSGPTSVSPTPTVTPSPSVTTSPSTGTTATPPPAGSAPAAPVATVCGAAPAGPASAPAGSVTVTTAQNLGDMVTAHAAGTTYWLTAGTHTLGTGAYDQVIPHNGDTFTGAPGAVLDGQHLNKYAFVGQATGVTVTDLTVQNFGAAGDNNNEGVVNHDAGAGWIIAGNRIQGNAGAGLMIGSGDRVSGNCLRDNGQYAFNAYSPNGVKDVVVDGNEIAGNDTDDWEKRQPGCGCTGGGKFWATSGAKVTGNYVHDNKGVGLWADSNNAGFLFQGNYIAGNRGPGLMYETSYNAAILNNTFVRNALVDGPGNPGFPTGAIYLSESGSDPRVPGPYGDVFRISGNVFTDNWSGVVAWENADRFAGSPANTSTGMSTLVNPTVATVAACGTASLVSKAPYLDDCRWKTQNLLVDHNTFTLDPAHVASCNAAVSCGFNALFSNYGTYPTWSPYQGETVENHIAFSQNNHWQANTYTGPWTFAGKSQDNRLTLAQWQAAPYGQDAGSTTR